MQVGSSLVQVETGSLYTGRKEARMRWKVFGIATTMNTRRKKVSFTCI